MKTISLARTYAVDSLLVPLEGEVRLGRVEAPNLKTHGGAGKLETTTGGEARIGLAHRFI